MSRNVLEALGVLAIILTVYLGVAWGLPALLMLLLYFPLVYALDRLLARLYSPRRPHP